MLRVWNVTLVIVTFFLTIFGTFMTRSGVVQSVHAFGEDKKLALMFTIFMVTILTVSFGLVIYRLPLLRARNELDSWVSREAAFLANNWILLFSAFFVLFATMFPTLSEAVNGQRLTVGPPFFNKWMLPIGLMLLLLTGIGPLLAWRKSSVANMVHQFLWPTVAALVTGGDARGARRARVGQRHLFRALRVRDRDDRSGVRARRVRAQGRHRLRHPDRDDRPGRPLAAALRRLHRPRRDGARVPWLRGPGVQAGRAGAAEAGPGRQGRQVLRPSRCAARDQRRPETDGHRPRHGERERPRDRRAAAGAVVLQQARRRADHRGGDPAIGQRGRLRRAGVVRRLDPDGDLRGHDQPARGLDLGRLRGDCARDRSGADARDGVRVRGVEGARGGAGGDGALPADAAPPRPRGPRTTRPSGGSARRRSSASSKEKSCARAAAGARSPTAACPTAKGMRRRPPRCGST